MDIVEIGTFTNTKGCIRGSYELFDGKILVQFIERIEIVELIAKPVSEQSLFDEEDDVNAKVVHSMDVEDLDRVLPLEKSPYFVLVFSQKIVMYDLDFRIVWESSHMLDLVEDNNVEESKKRRNRKEIRHRTGVKNPLLLNDRLIVAIVKKKKLVIHDLLERKSKLASPEEIEKHILRIRIYDSSNSRLIMMLSGGQTGIFVIGLTQMMYLKLICLRKVFDTEFTKDRVFMSAMNNRLIGFSKSSIRSWGLDQKSDVSITHNVPIFGISGSSSLGNKMVASTSFDVYSRNMRGYVQSINFHLGLGVDPSHLNCNFYVLIDFETLTAKTIGRVKKVKSSRGYPTLFLESKEEEQQQIKKTNQVLLISQTISQERERQEEEEENNNNNNNSYRGSFRGRGRRRRRRNNNRRRRVNTFSKWEDPNEEKMVWCSIYDFDAGRMLLKEKCLMISRANDSPSMLRLKKKGDGIILVLIGNKVFQIVEEKKR